MRSRYPAGTSGAKESSLTALISRLHKRKIPHFHKLMPEMAVTHTLLGSLDYALGFPVSFVRAHSSQIGERATFQCTNYKQTWPIKITMKVDPAGKSVRVIAYGRGGWKAFVVDKGIQVRDTLVFSLVGFSSFKIDVIRAARPAARAEAHKKFGSLDPSSVPKKIVDAPLPCECCRKVASPYDPVFVVNVGPEDVNELRVPGNFWEVHRYLLPSRDWALKGPDGVVHRVKAAGTFHEAEQGLSAIHLESGWKQFFVSNQSNGFRIGEPLEFILKDEDCFSVSVHRLQFGCFRDIEEMNDFLDNN